MSKPDCLSLQNNGIYSFQVYIPAALRAKGTPPIIARSLRTSVKREARAIERPLSTACHFLFGEVQSGRLDREALPGRIRALVADALRAPADPALDTFLQRVDAMWKTPLFLDAEPAAEHPGVSEPVCLRRFAAFERGPVQPHRVRRWTVLRDVPSPEHSNVRRRLGILSPSEFGDLFDSL
ncbi:DUF6538 domain-containing protein [Burkholderia vietnamiensis]|uniref:DUF6538 domain-containing protein n=1 Tax=Burkholderia vietnamiensis TaxID=60552 RepID=UPI00159438E9|nr:DUF6538 domain-containing protein [Burkholderia vietnamiensis]